LHRAVERKAVLLCSGAAIAVGTAVVIGASRNASGGFSILNSVATTPGATIVHAVGASGAGGSTNPLALQNG